METKEYFILKGRDKSGPYSFSNLEELKIEGDTKIWFSGLSNWTKASDLPELAAIITYSPPPHSSTKKKTVILLAGLLLLAILIFGISRLFNSGPKVLGESSMSNQQLYLQYAPSIVLIKQRYMYEIKAGNQTFWFNDFYGANGMGIISGLTDDSLIAAGQAEIIQGTGFFISKDGKILTNRHIMIPDPNADDLELIRRNFHEILEGNLNNVNTEDSIRQHKKRNDSILTVLLKDSVTNSTSIAEIRNKITDEERFLNGDKYEDDDSYVMKLTAEQIAYLKTQSIRVKKITLEFHIFTQGTNLSASESGINCHGVVASAKEDVDLAIIQTDDRSLPDTSVHLIDLSRINSVTTNKNLLPKMSERVILIGFNHGTDLAQTTAGIQAQLTEGKISQNTDAYRLMYTIPTLAGSSGSPVLDEKGRLVSVNFAGMSETQSFNYGVQSKQIRSFLKANKII